MAKKIEDKKFIKSELAWKEQEKDKKAFYKNWKTYAVVSGVAIIGTGTGLGIYYGVNNNSGSIAPVPIITEQDIATEINTKTYTVEAIIDQESESITSQITGSFIQAQLTGEIKNAFKLESFKTPKVMVGDHEINNEDLTEVKIIDAQIVYNYGSIINQSTKLTIDVTEAKPVPTEDEIATAISGTTYELSKPAETLASTVEDEINAEFIKKGLEDNQPIYDAFDGGSLVFDVNKITVGGNKLTDENLKTPILLVAKINYSYGSIANQSTTLNITVDPFEITDQVMWEKIKDTVHKATFESGIKAVELNNQIKAIVKINLPENYQKSFIEARFTSSKIWQITNDGEHILVNDADLINSGIKNFYITFGYKIDNTGTTTDTKLEITLT